MRKSEASLAVIRRTSAGETCWLALWNAKWGAFHFVGGHRHTGEAPRDCLTREIFEELGLVAGVDCHVAPEALAHLEYTAWSERAEADTAYAMDLFLVTLEPSAQAAVESDDQARWIAPAEVRAGRCQDGRAVSPTMAFLLDHVGTALEAIEPSHPPSEDLR